jgi:hypothetical protein
MGLTHHQKCIHFLGGLNSIHASECDETLQALMSRLKCTIQLSGLS